MEIKLDGPVAAALSVPGESRWGVHQFPTLNYLPDGRILLSYADAADASETHGRQAPALVSSDRGASWKRHSGFPRAVRPHFSISRIYNGEFLVMPAAPYLDIGTDGIVLPEPVSSAVVYGVSYSYRAADLPASVLEYFRSIPASRWDPDARRWTDTFVDYDTEGLIAWRKEGSSLLPRTFFEHPVLVYRGELLYADYRAQYAFPGGGYPVKAASFLMASTDNGRTFRRRSLIAVDPAGADLMGEPHVAETASGRLVAVVRRTDHEQKPMIVTWSEDGGYTWRDPAPLFGFGVFPNVLLLENGILAVSYGRPGVRVAFASDGEGEVWDREVTLVEGDPTAISRHTCGYTSMLPLDEDRFLVAYSDFTHPSPDGGTCKAIVTRVVEARP